VADRDRGPRESTGDDEADVERLRQIRGHESARGFVMGKTVVHGGELRGEYFDVKILHV
jgi:hypothetical protein